MMLTLGNLTLDAPFFQAGLAGYSDTAMRLVARRHGAPYAVTEAMLDFFLLHGGKGLAAAELDAADHPIAGQLMGSFPDDMARAARVLVSLGYDVIDVNLACPVKKIRKRSRGGHLLSVPDEAVAILAAVRQATPPQIPCTVKLRRGTDDSAQAERDFRQILEAAIRLGYAGAVVHGRTVVQKYHGPSNWDWLARLVNEYGLHKPRPSGSVVFNEPRPSGSETNFILGGSGDIWTVADIFRMLAATGVRWVSVARGCIGNPWIFRQARALLAGNESEARRPPTIHEQRDVLLEHFTLAARLHGEATAAREMRKFGLKFSRHHPAQAAVAQAFIQVRHLADWRAVVAEHYQSDGPGAVADMSHAPLVSCVTEGEGGGPAAVDTAAPAYADKVVQTQPLA